MFTKYCKQEKVKKCKTLIYQICFCKVSFVIKTSWFVFVKSCHFITKSLLQLISAPKSKTCHIVVVCVANMSCCVLSITGLIRWTQNMLPMMRWTILTRWLRILWPLLVGCSSCSHIPQGKEQVILKSWTEPCLCKCKMSGVSDESD